MELRFLAVSALCHGALILGAGLMMVEHTAPGPAVAVDLEVLPPSPDSARSETVLDEVPVPVEETRNAEPLLEPVPLSRDEPDPLTPLAEIPWRDMPPGTLVLPRKAPVEEPAEDPGIPAEPVPYLEATALAGNSPPDYPRRARRLGQEGVVVARIGVDRSGAVTEVVLVERCRFELLNEAVLRAVPKWRFEPAVRGGVTVATTILQRFRFILTSG